MYLSAVERKFESRLGQTKDYEIAVCYFSAKHTALRRKSKDLLAQNQSNVSEWIHKLLFQWTSTIKIQISVLVQYKAMYTYMYVVWNEIHLNNILNLYYS